MTTLFVGVLVLTLAGLGHSQTLSPNSREALIQHIQEQAKRDLDVERLQRPEDVQKLFAEEAKQVGLPVADIDKTYDEAYAQAKDAKETEFASVPGSAERGYSLVEVSTSLIQDGAE